VLAAPVTHALASAAVDAPELFDIDVHELAGPLALIALGRLQAQSSQPAHPDPGQDPRHRRERHAQQLRDLKTGEPQSAQRGDRLDPPLAGAIGHHIRRRAAIQQTALSAAAVTGHPLPTGSWTGFRGGRGSLDRPALLDDPQHHPTPLRQ
jgi:hypothetical protein